MHPPSWNLRKLTLTYNVSNNIFAHILNYRLKDMPQLSRINKQNNVPNK